MHKVADWQLAQSQQYFAAFDRSKQLDGEIWTWGALYSGLMAMSESLGDPKYANVMRDTGKAYNWELSKTEGDANQQSMAQTFLELYLMDKKPEELAPTQKRYDAILAGPRVAVGAPAEDRMVVVRCAVHGAAIVGAAICGDRRQEVHYLSG